MIGNKKIVAIDARMIEMSGIGTYIQNLMGKGIYDYALGDEKTIRKYDEKVKIIPYYAPIYSLKEQLLFPNKKVKKNNISLIHFPHYNVPISYRGPYVVTVHDLIHLIFPEFLGTKIKYYYAKFLIRHALFNAKHIFTVSTNSKKDICSFFKIDPEKITVTYNAVEKEFHIKNKSEIEYLYTKYNISRNKFVLLYVGNLKPHKNLNRLLEAFSKLKKKDKFCLILVGKSFQNCDLIKKEKLLEIEDYIVHTGLVDKEELVDLYNFADLFIFPSLYEGFGIPLLEAMACGTPVIASNNSSIPEVVENAALLFDATNVQDIKEAIETIFLDPDLLITLKNEGKKQAAKFKWLDNSNKVKKTLYKIVQGDNNEKNSI